MIKLGGQVSLNTQYCTELRHELIAFLPGYCGLGRTVKALGLGTSKTIEMDVVVGALHLSLCNFFWLISSLQAASLGSIKDSLLKALYYACQGMQIIRAHNKGVATRLLTAM